MDVQGVGAALLERAARRARGGGEGYSGLATATGRIGSADCRTCALHLSPWPFLALASFLPVRQGWWPGAASQEGALESGLEILCRHWPNPAIFPCSSVGSYLGHRRTSGKATSYL